MLLIESTLDDSTAEQISYLTNKLITTGARDAWSSSVCMKKGRLGTVVTALTTSNDVDMKNK